jgi:hypothetical protein
MVYILCMRVFLCVSIEIYTRTGKDETETCFSLTSCYKSALLTYRKNFVSKIHKTVGQILRIRL